MAGAIRRLADQAGSKAFDLSHAAKEYGAHAGGVWHGPQGGQRYIRYDLNRGTIISGLEESFGFPLNPANFDLPPLPPPPITSDKPIVFVRPVTVREEWRNEARNPRPEYIAAICDALTAEPSYCHRGRYCSRRRMVCRRSAQGRLASSASANCR